MKKLKFAVAGTGAYLKEGLILLEKNNYTPEFVIDDSTKIISKKNEIEERNVDLLICLAHPNILTKREISLFEKGGINLHPGLPAYRGRHPVNWMLIDGVREIPIAVHFINEGIDTGDILMQDSIFVARDDDYSSVLKKIVDTGIPLIFHVLKQIENNCFYSKKQHKSLLEYTLRRTPKDSLLDWNKTGYELHNFIRALIDPMPNAFCFTESGEKVQLQYSFRGKRVGEVLARTDDSRYVISTKDGVIFVKIDKELKVGERLAFGVQ
ncbi:MAG: hypothetical protein GXP17_00420 [Gammaproteobacteria bacterium]|nr:hypothetical protein [Gammaproteobacteria bacterium]